MATRTARAYREPPGPDNQLRRAAAKLAAAVAAEIDVILRGRMTQDSLAEARRRPGGGSKLALGAIIEADKLIGGDPPMESWDIRALNLEPHRPQVLRSDDETRAIAIRLPAGEELQEHQVHERAYLLVVEGQIEISHDGNNASGGAGFLSHFGPNERRTVRAMADSRLLLVLAPWPGIGHPSRVAAARTQD